MIRKDVREVRWLEGLRGISALFIVTSHIFTKLNPNLESPAPSAKASPDFVQLPIIRLLIAGRASLSFFFLLTGFVNSLSFLRETRAGNHSVALAGLARSSFRRIGRLVLPATAATTLSWALCQFGAYTLAKDGDVDWFRDMSPDPSPTIPWAICHLLKEVWRTWAKTANEYDKVQWNLLFLLKASMFVYLILLMTTYVTPRSRKLFLVLYWLYSWSSNDTLIGMNVASGMLLAELLTDATQSLSPTKTPQHYASLLSKGLPPLVLLIGLIVAGFPEKNPSWTKWSHVLDRIGLRIFFTNVELDRDWGSVGGGLILLGTLYTPFAKSALSHRWLVWMGKVSYSIFLIHTALIRSVLCWMLYNGVERSRTMDDDGVISKGRLRHRMGAGMVASLAVFFVLLYPVAWAWNRWVEAACGRVVAWVEERMFAEEFKEKGRGAAPLLSVAS